MAVQKIKTALAISLVGLFVLFPNLVLAGIPETINYQGYLTTSNNTPLHGEFPMTFKIYDSSTDGVALWEESRNVIAFFGIVNVMLGEVTPFPPSLLFDRAYFLGVQVGADQEMTPRLTLTSTAYAFGSKVADNFPNPGGWTDSGNVVSLSTGSDRVGIGTSSFSEKLHVQGTGTLQGIFESPISSGGIQLVSSPNSQTQIQQKYELQSLSNGNFIIYNRTNPAVNFGYYLEIDTNGNVGVGTRTPTSKLDVNGEVRTRGSLVFTDSRGDPYPDNWIGMADNIEGTTRWLHLGGITDGGARRLALYADRNYFNGWVGIGDGKTAPEERVDVNGNIKIDGTGNGVIFPDGTKQLSSPANGNGGFPSPAYDSGWVAITPNQGLVLDHNLGEKGFTDVNKYRIDLQRKYERTQNIGNSGFGGDSYIDNLDAIHYTGFYFCCLTSSSITVFQEQQWGEDHSVRIRIWVYN